MTICLIGQNLTTLVLGKILVNKGLKVDLYYSNNKFSKNKLIHLQEQSDYPMTI